MMMIIIIILGIYSHYPPFCEGAQGGYKSMGEGKGEMELHDNITDKKQ